MEEHRRRVYKNRMLIRILDTRGSDWGGVGGCSRYLHVFAHVRFLQAGGRALTDSEVMMLITHGHIPSHQLEKAVGNPERGVCIRRKFLNKTAKLNDALTHLPYQHYDYSKVSNIIVVVG